MTSENQSAVDFLINQWLYLDTEFEMGLMDKNTYWQKLREIQSQAKEMEEQLKKCKCGNPIVGGYSCMRTDCNQTK